MITCDVVQNTKGENLWLTFFTDTGKFGTHEILDDYELTSEQLLDILQEWREKNDRENI